MRVLALALLSLCLLAQPADAGKKKRHTRHKAVAARHVQAVSKAKVDRQRTADENRRAEAELADVRAGRASTASSEERPMVAQELGDKEVPPRAPR